MSGSQKTGAARAVIVSDNDETVEAREQRAAPAGAVEAPTPAPKKSRRSAVLPVLGLAVLVGGGWFGYDWWTDGRFLVSTDDAYIEGDIATISPKVTGYVEKVNVIANQQVKAGDPLVTLDQGDYRIVLDQAEAQIATQKLSLDRIDAQIGGAKASLQQAEAQKTALEATVRGAEITFKRAGDLQSKSVGTVASLDNARVALDQAKANLAAGDANIASAKAAILILEAQRQETASGIRALELVRDKARRDLDFTVLKAPYDGIIGNLSVQTGDLVSAGQRLAALVPVHELYIDANFKETQIHRLKTGEKVRVHVDAFDETTIEGTVQSISPASGSVFSMLPAENATGNFTKVVQRVPVRIALPKDVLDRGHLRAGLSVVVDVDTRTAPASEAVAAVK
ncbi:HlyD family secretion protein [Rhizobiaceae bacterium n13]|uniref:HlyD family secretion protein n=1 Tax=Ferirhizobium litorale TaxID=2927786 RepID=A0AAE3Q982_9HYPH|nr:HlyD family secretion protein [Fererhizobium litorale]MDI7860431.1 HlyD family secretion protein [Fererhizobium litorale]MDI7920566.1 HlyD family secretion protein [Fererhizobium litorale]